MKWRYRSFAVHLSFPMPAPSRCSSGGLAIGHLHNCMGHTVCRWSTVKEIATVTVLN